MITEVLSGFSKAEQKYLVKELEWGWENITYGKNQDDRDVVQGKKKLDELKTRVFN